jgi:tRNA dimethylallyltransferase
MIKQGLVDEVKNLMAKGYGLDLPAMSGIGYKQIAMFTQGEIDLIAAIELIKKETHRFARHQYAWFRLGDARIRWLDEYDDVSKDAANLVASFLAGIYQ